MSRLTGLPVLALVLAGSALAGGARRLEAQVFGLPVRNAGIPTGLTLAADAGFSNSHAGGGWAIGASAAVGLGPLGVSGLVSWRDPDGDDGFSSVGATGNLKIFGGPLIPLSLTAQAGFAYGQQDVPGPTAGENKLWHFPVGLGLALTIPNPVVAIKPWIAPRVDIVRVRPPAGGDSDTSTDFGVSAGVDLSFLSGLGIRVMYDRVQAGDGVHPSIVSVGLSWGLRLGR